MKQEEWKAVPNYNGLYSASTNGRIISYAKSKTGRILNGTLDIKGYRCYMLQYKNRPKLSKGHRLVMLAFKGESDLQVNHLNGIKDDNRLLNLEYCTNKENSHHLRYVLGVKCEDKIRGENNYASKLTEDDVFLIYILRGSGSTFKELSKIFTVSKTTIFKIVKGIKWNHVHNKYKTLIILPHL